jgi:hypothetical protein
MPNFNLPIKDAGLSLGFALLIALLNILWLRGGASRVEIPSGGYRVFPHAGL